MHWGDVKPVDMVATVMDLARRGYLHIEEIRGVEGLLFKRAAYDYKMTVVREADGATTPYERIVIELLADAASGSDGVTDDELRAWAKENPSVMESRMGAFEHAVQDHGKRLGLINTNYGVMAGNISAIVVAAAVALLGIATVSREPIDAFRNAPGGIVALALLVGQAAMTPLLRRRTARGAGQYRAWGAFRRFLKDFSRMHEYRPPAVAVWEQYLVYAVPLGVAGAVAEALRVHAPTAVASQGFGWYAFSADGHAGFGDSITSFTESFTASAQAAFATAPSSGSGGGGGFSGGGGGGGGGGSSGAD